jgi:hypothetical protein
LSKGSAIKKEYSLSKKLDKLWSFKGMKDENYLG